MYDLSRRRPEEIEMEMLSVEDQQGKFRKTVDEHDSHTRGEQIKLWQETKDSGSGQGGG